MDQPEFVEVNEIKDLLTFLKSIDWSDSWLLVLLAFHIGITMLSFLSRNMVNFQVVLFLSLLFMVYFSEFLNEVAARNWHKFSKQQYFDSNGLFISVIFSCPILLNCMFLLARFLHQSFELMTKVKTAQLQQQLKRRQNAKELPKELPKVLPQNDHAKQE